MSLAARRLAALGAAALALAGCSLLPDVTSFFGGQMRLAVEVDSALNDDSPVAVETLIVYDAKLVDQLTALTAAQWFERREQFLRDHEQGALDHWLWEWVPGQRVADQRLDFRVGAQAAVVFAGYLTPGDHRQRVAPHGEYVLVLGRTGFTVSPRHGGGRG